jgi:hypothetical protein
MSFSSVKKITTPEINHPHKEIIEASECLKNWWDHGVILQQEDTIEGLSFDDHKPPDDKDDDGDL